MRILPPPHNPHAAYKLNKPLAYAYLSLLGLLGCASIGLIVFICLSRA
jgi:hypothetical protein